MSQERTVQRTDNQSKFLRIQAVPADRPANYIGSARRSLQRESLRGPNKTDPLFRYAIRCDWASLQKSRRPQPCASVSGRVLSEPEQTARRGRRVVGSTHSIGDRQTALAGHAQARSAPPPHARLWGPRTVATTAVHHLLRHSLSLALACGSGTLTDSIPPWAGAPLGAKVQAGRRLAGVGWTSTGGRARSRVGTSREGRGGG